MEYRIITLDIAYDDLKEIKKHLAQFYPGTVKRFVATYKKRLNTLKNTPFAFSVYSDDPNYRRFVVNDFLVFYTVNKETKVVEVHRVIRGSRDIKRQL